MIRRGDRFRCKSDLPVLAMTSWAAPSTGGYQRVLPAGEAFTASHDASGTGSAVYCDLDPADYRRLHKAFIPLSDRLRFWSYRGYYLCIQTRDIAQICELVSAGPEDETVQRARRRKARRSGKS